MNSIGLIIRTRQGQLSKGATFFCHTMISLIRKRLRYRWTSFTSLIFTLLVTGRIILPTQCL